MSKKKARWAAILVALLFIIFFFAAPGVAIAQEGRPQEHDVATSNCEEQLIWPYRGRLGEDFHQVGTLGIHGGDYGHEAVDISAGNGAINIAPTCGEVRIGIDGVGNPYVEIHNRNFVVTLLHGVYSVTDRQWVDIGEPIGQESKLGNANGIYHSHFNVFVKAKGQSINPYSLIEDGIVPPLASWLERIRHPLPSVVKGIKVTGVELLLAIAAFIILRKVLRVIFGRKASPFRFGAAMGVVLALLAFTLALLARMQEEGIPPEVALDYFFGNNGLVAHLVGEAAETVHAEEVVSHSLSMFGRMYDHLDAKGELPRWEDLPALARAYQFLPAGSVSPATGEAFDSFVMVSHYWPPLGGTNCFDFRYTEEHPEGYCYSQTASGKDWEELVDIGIACPPELPFGTTVTVHGKTWICEDRGGAINVRTVTVDGEPQQAFVVDMLTPRPVAPHLSVAPATIRLPER